MYDASGARCTIATMGSELCDIVATSAEKEGVDPELLIMWKSLTLADKGHNLEKTLSGMAGPEWDAMRAEGTSRLEGVIKMYVGYVLQAIPTKRLMSYAA